MFALRIEPVAGPVVFVPLRPSESAEAIARKAEGWMNEPHVRRLEVWSLDPRGLREAVIWGSDRDAPGQLEHAVRDRRARTARPPAR